MLRSIICLLKRNLYVLKRCITPLINHAYHYPYSMYQNCLVVKSQSLNKQRTYASLAEVLMNDQISLSYILRLVIGK